MLKGSTPDEDPQDFIDQLKRVLIVMHASETEALENRLGYEMWPFYSVSLGNGLEDQMHLQLYGRSIQMPFLITNFH